MEKHSNEVEQEEVEAVEEYLDEDVEQPEESSINEFPQERLEKVYDLCVRIHSIKRAREGWNVFGKRVGDLNQPINSKFVCVQGDENVGKSLLIGLLANKLEGNDLTKIIPHDFAEHTPGVCFAMPDDAKLSHKKGPSTPKAAPSATASPAAAPSQVDERLQRVAKRAPQAAASAKRSAVVINGLCYMDSEGQERDRGGALSCFVCRDQLTNLHHPVKLPTTWTPALQSFSCAKSFCSLLVQRCTCTDSGATECAPRWTTSSSICLRCRTRRCIHRLQDRSSSCTITQRFATSSTSEST